MRMAWSSLLYTYTGRIIMNKSRILVSEPERDAVNLHLVDRYKCIICSESFRCRQPENGQLFRRGGNSGEVISAADIYRAHHHHCQLENPWCSCLQSAPGTCKWPVRISSHWEDLEKGVQRRELGGGGAVVLERVGSGMWSSLL